MKILIISGFLGAGKTTFIKEIIKRCKEQFVVLENEYGQNSLDSKEIKNSTTQDLQLIDFAEGCVCCTQKDTFSNTILAISAGLDPEYLIVEPTGVGKLSNIMKAIEKVSYNRIQILPPIVVINPESFEENIHLYGDICLDQIKNARKIVLSKIENSDPELIKYVVKQIRQINDQAEIIDEHYTLKDDDFYEDLLLLDGEQRVVESDDNAIELDQLTLKDITLNNPTELIVFLEDLIHHDFGLIPRAKGAIKIANEMIRFDVADNLYALTDDEYNQTNECVFIGKNIDRVHIINRLHAKTVSNKNTKFKSIPLSRNK